jgi:cell division protein FtsW
VTAASGAFSPTLPKPRTKRATAPPRRSALVLLLALVAVLSLVGLVMILSASSVQSIRQYHSPWYYFGRQLLWLAIGAVAFVIAFRVHYQRWRRLAPAAVVVTLVGLLAVLIPGVGITVSGASRWLGRGTFVVQPSEIAKLALIFFAADILDRRLDRGKWWYTMVPVLIVLVLFIALVMKQPDMGTSLVLAAIAVGILFAAGCPLVALGGIAAAGAGGALVMAVAAPYRWARLTSFLHPMHSATNSGYQAVQALASMGQGGLLGSGLGSSVASWGYLPNQQTDFIFAVVGEETGLVGSMVLVGLFAALALVGVRIACSARDRFGSLVAAGITAWLLSQAIINVGAVVGLLPVTGVPLPFVSFGGSSLVIALFGVGVLANIARSS